MRKFMRGAASGLMLFLAVLFCGGWTLAPMALDSTTVYLRVPERHTVSVSVQFDGWVEAETADGTTEIRESGSVTVSDGGTLTLIFHPGTGSVLKSVRFGEAEQLDRVADGRLVLEDIRDSADITVRFGPQPAGQETNAGETAGTAPAVKTGDHTPYGMYTAVCLLSAAALAVTLAAGRKRNL